MRRLPMHVEMMMVGTELLLGQIVDTNASFIAKTLAEHGIGLYRKTTVGDNGPRICVAMTEALERCDVLLVSGGLGPTEDDITRECVADVFGVPLEERADLLETLKARFATFGRPMSPNNRKQARVPKGAQAIANPNGTAPGFIIDAPQGIAVCMPGVPHELEAMLVESVVPYLRERFGLQGVIVSRILTVCGMGESSVDAKIGDLMNASSNPTVALLASPEAVQIRITAHAASEEEADKLIDEVNAVVEGRLPGRIMGGGDDTLEQVVGGLLAEKGWTLSVAETNSGGMLAQRLTGAGVSSFVAGLVVPSRGLVEGEASAKAVDFACRSRDFFSTDCAIGIAADEADNRNVAAFVTPENTYTWEFAFAGVGKRSQLRTCIVTLERVRRILLEASGEDV